MDHPHKLTEHKKIIYDSEVFVCSECETIQVNGPQFNCKLCSYDLCNSCYLKKSGKNPTKSKRNSDDYFAQETPVFNHQHPHPLRYYPVICYVSGKYRCDVCRKHFEDGEHYHCIFCNYDNCKSCFIKLTGNTNEVKDQPAEPKLKGKSLSSPSMITSENKPQADANTLRMPKQAELFSTLYTTEIASSLRDNFKIMQAQNTAFLFPHCSTGGCSGG
eukprot:TRINITY_DN1801_c0_g1_i6.p1 TRINITY_DN1801_c0_g1~~TRINITY_DN1801_c0_g1_i6.p1  ORF type:complete len:217 (+),score=29.15 TRINITY_DN1801_c0_g1_i6:266-916(+)